MRPIAVCLAAFCVATNPATALADRSDAGRIEGTFLTPEAGAAIDRALEHLAKGQSEDGSWGGRRSRHPVALTGLSLLAFMVRGHFPETETYGDVMTKGLDFLLEESQRTGGYMGSSMYEHALATLALAEIWGMSGQERAVRDALKSATDVIITGQDNMRGGWRYQPRSGSDGTVTVGQLVALAAAREAGVFVPDSTIANAVGYVESLQERITGGFGYTAPVAPTFTQTACGVASLIYSGYGESRAASRGIEFLMNLDEQTFLAGGGVSHYHYGHYYAILSMYQRGGEYFGYWYPRIRDELVKSQREDGSWGGGYVTPMSVLILGMATRFLPIHQR